LTNAGAGDALRDEATPDTLSFGMACKGCGISPRRGAGAFNAVPRWPVMAHQYPPFAPDQVETENLRLMWFGKGVGVAKAPFLPLAGQARR
tara:strand:- start:783 stop:1055 length:273 start_codon:yes stop_codon:yes gene_type:complete